MQIVGYTNFLLEPILSDIFYCVMHYCIELTFDIFNSNHLLLAVRQLEMHLLTFKGNNYLK